MKEWAELLDEDKKTTHYHSRAMFTGTIQKPGFKKSSFEIFDWAGLTE